MKSLFFIPALLLASPTFADDLKCGPGVYCTEQMLCIGRIEGTPPKTMSKDYYVEILTLRSAKSQRKDGTFADTLMMNVKEVGSTTPNITMGEAKRTADWAIGQYGPPARIKGNKVTTKWSVVGFSDGLNLTLNSSEDRSGHQLDHLTGWEDIQGSVIGDYKLNYECDALKTDEPTLQVRNTRN
jgi:hypothetical protein